MTNVYDEEGRSVSCTLIEAGPCVVTQVKDVEKDGYRSIQLSYDERKEKRTTKALKGHFDKANTTPKKKVVEFRKFCRYIRLVVIIERAGSNRFLQ